MIRIFIAAVLLVVHPSLYAQFNQKAKERKRQLEQMAALKIYLGYIKQGYGIVRDGNRLISDIKNGDLGLHRSYFGSLEKVNPDIRNSDKVAAIIRMQQEMATQRQQLARKAVQSGLLTAAELRELNLLHAAISAASDKDLEALQLVITDGKLRMTDDQRIARIEQLYEKTIGDNVYQNRFSRRVAALMTARRQATNDQEILRALHD